MPSSPTRRPTAAAEPLWIVAEEVAALLGIHRSTVWRWIDQGLLPPPRRIGGRTLWLRADVELFARCNSLGELRRLKAKPGEP
jgi:excisionase family DNA binding protein